MFFGDSFFLVLSHLAFLFARFIHQTSQQCTHQHSEIFFLYSGVVVKQKSPQINVNNARRLVQKN